MWRVFLNTVYVESILEYCVCGEYSSNTLNTPTGYVVAMISKLLKIIGLFCKRAL